MPRSRTFPTPSAPHAHRAWRGLLAGLGALVVPVLMAQLSACGAESTADLLEVRKVVIETRSDPVFLPDQRVPGSVDTLTLWLGPDLARRDTGHETFLIDEQRRELTLVDHAARTWTRQTADQIQETLRLLAADTLIATEEDYQIGQLKSVLNVTAQVTETHDESTIDGYRCRRWLVEQDLGDHHITSELWLTEDIDMDQELLHRATRPALAAIPGGREAIAELSRLRGAPVRTTSVIEVFGSKSRSETRLLSVETVYKAADFFRPPAHYRPCDSF